MDTDDRLDRIAAHQARMIEADRRAAEAAASHDREMAAIRAEFLRGVRLYMQDARADRNKRLQSDEMLARLAAAQLVTEEKLQRYLRSGNGKP